MTDARLLAQRLEPLLSEGTPAGLEDFLASNSNLPGPRGNLELAAAFAGHFRHTGAGGRWWETLLAWTHVTEREAPTGDPREFLPFCALQALGEIYDGADSERQEQIVALLRHAASDGRWRLREGVAMGLQRIGERDFGDLRRILTDWLPDATFLERRAIVAALAHPPVLKTSRNAQYCLEVSERIISDLASVEFEARKTEGFKVLRQGLEYAVSVFVASLPDEGFALLRRWAVAGDPDVRRIVKSNLGKGRLAKKYPEQVAETLALL